MSTVPDSDNLSFNNDIQMAVWGNIQNFRTLLGAFAAANDAFFDNFHKGQKDRQLNFRNYGPHHAVVPSAPTGLTGQQIPTRRAQYSWNHVYGADGYKVQWHTGELYKIVDVGSTNSWTSPEQPVDTTVQARVLAYNANGDGPYSGWVSVYLP